MNKGFVARNGFNEGSGEHLCLGIFQGLSSTELAAVNAAATSSGVGATELIDYNLADSSNVSNVGASIVDAVFGNGSYCESQMGADERAFSYRLVGSATYNNFNNSAWSLSPSFVWSHDPIGYGPSSLGGFAEGRQSLSLSLTARKGDAITTSVSYVDQLGDPTDNSRGDMDYISANVSYAF
jgi:cellulase/cellobiase CelA1